MNARSHWLRHAPRAALGGVLLAVAVGMFLFVRHMLNAEAPSAKKTVQQITLVQPPPPPPPPPKVEEPPPEPEVKDEVKPDPEPEPQNDEAANDQPAGDDLGLDADGGAGGDAFGLVGKKGGRDLIGGAGGSRFAWYSGVLQREIQDLLSDNTRVRKRKHSVVMNLWIAHDGHIDRAELVRSSGDKEIDEAYRASIGGRRITERPPEDMPQPIKIKITSRS